MKKFDEKNVAENPLYHDTWKLLKKYRDVVWSLELSVQHVRTKFEDRVWHFHRGIFWILSTWPAPIWRAAILSITPSALSAATKMLKLLDSAVDLLRTKHKNGEAYYWLLYYSFLSPAVENVEEIIENLRPHIGIFPSVPITVSGGRPLKAPQFRAVGIYLKDSLNVLEQFSQT